MEEGRGGCDVRNNYGFSQFFWCFGICAQQNKCLVSASMNIKDSAANI